MLTGTSPVYIIPLGGMHLVSKLSHNDLLSHHPQSIFPNPLWASLKYPISKLLSFTIQINFKTDQLLTEATVKFQRVGPIYWEDLSFQTRIFPG
jgi:hypothetical protein